MAVFRKKDQDVSELAGKVAEEIDFEVDPVAEAQQEIEEGLKSKKGTRKREAAEAKKLYVQTANVLIKGWNKFATARLDGYFTFDQEDQRVVSTLAGKVLEKRLDPAAVEWSEEMMLLAYLIGWGAEQAAAYAETKRDRNGTGPAGDGENDADS